MKGRHEKRAARQRNNSPLATRYTFELSLPKTANNACNEGYGVGKVWSVPREKCSSVVWGTVKKNVHSINAMIAKAFVHAIRVRYAHDTATFAVLRLSLKKVLVAAPPACAVCIRQEMTSTHGSVNLCGEGYEV